MRDVKDSFVFRSLIETIFWLLEKPLRRKVTRSRRGSTIDIGEKMSEIRGEEEIEVVEKLEQRHFEKYKRGGAANDSSILY